MAKRAWKRHIEQDTKGLGINSHVTMRDLGNWRQAASRSYLPKMHGMQAETKVSLQQKMGPLLVHWVAPAWHSNLWQLTYSAK